MPQHQMVNKLDIKLVVRDPAVQKQLEADELCHNTGTLQGLAGMLDRTNDLYSGKIQIGEGAGEGGVTRVWIGHGEKDGITNPHASKSFAERIQAKDKEFKLYPGYYHRRRLIAYIACIWLTWRSARRAGGRQGRVCERRGQLDPGAVRGAGAGGGGGSQVEAVKGGEALAWRSTVMDGVWESPVYMYLLTGWCM